MAANEWRERFHDPIIIIGHPGEDFELKLIGHLAISVEEYQDIPSPEF
jgi:hypothetical protein